MTRVRRIAGHATRVAFLAACYGLLAATVAAFAIAYLWPLVDAITGRWGLQ